MVATVVEADVVAGGAAVVVDAESSSPLHAATTSISPATRMNDGARPDMATP
ncbi:MAG: hypothetical protein GY722_29350 [bacterium]|nr:hypothetical protein [bacterium]